MWSNDEIRKLAKKMGRKVVGRFEICKLCQQGYVFDLECEEFICDLCAVGQEKELRNIPRPLGATDEDGDCFYCVGCQTETWHRLNRAGVYTCAKCDGTLERGCNQ